MKKLSLLLIVAGTLCYSEFMFAASSNWTGYYVGANAGYWNAANIHLTSTGSPGYVNQAYQPGASNIANALAQLAGNSSSLNSFGFIGGGQVGYNREYSKGILLGISADLDYATNADNNITMQKTVNLVDYDESYAGSLAVNQRINYLGTVRARLGYLYTPNFLIFATGGFAYGNVTLDAAWRAQESLGHAIFPTINTQNSSSNTRAGWVAGAGIEWLFNPNWSAMLEYTYYSLSNFTVPTTLAQTNASISPTTLWGTATTNTALSLSVWSIRVGLNYHFL